MPYTPPSKPSPPTSTAGSPSNSRRSSEAVARPTLPRSASYLTRHRRSPSTVTSLSSVSSVSNVSVDHGSLKQPTPPGTSEDLKSLVPHDSVRQSPPPVTDRRGMPSGAVISPPESLSGSDDEGLEMRGRKVDKLKELKAAVSHISVKRESSPTRPGELVIPRNALVGDAMHQSFSTGALDELATLSRKSPHARTSSVSIPASTHSPLTTSESESEDENRPKPPMIRKKSGELVRPALRPPANRRPSSMPGTPTFTKAVHFDSHLEHVRHFLQVDRPLAVSAGSSPIDSFESDSEYPFPSSEDESTPTRSRGPPFEWDMITANFPSDSLVRRSLPVRVEKIWLSQDQKFLHGSVVVANLAFNKFVACRFTLDYWKTTSEVAADYTYQLAQKTSPAGHDCWTFVIKLSDLANLETKTLFFCVRYNVNGHEYWDNNGGANFQVDFRKRFIPQNGKHGFRGAVSRPAVNPTAELPRSTRRTNPNVNPRPKSMPVGFSSQQIMGQGKQIKLSLENDHLASISSLPLKKNSKAGGGSESDNLGKSVKSPSGQAFGNRYDFGASLSQAKVGVRPPTVASSSTTTQATPSSTEVVNVQPSASGTDSPSTRDYSYEELLDRFCFFGSKQPSQQTKGTPPPAKSSSHRFDGSDDGFSSMSSARHYNAHRTGPAQHHSLRHDVNSNPFFLATALQSSSSGRSAATSPRSAPVLIPSLDRTDSTSPMRATSPASPAACSVSPRTGTSPYLAPRHDRFAFKPETHVAAAIRG